MRSGALRRRGSLGRAIGLTIVVAIALAAPAHAAFDCGAYFERCQVQLDDSGRAWFGSVEKLTEDAPGDGTLKHGVFEVYERADNTTTLVSRGLDGQPIPFDAHRVSATLNGVSPDGSRVYISTEAPLSPEDHDPIDDSGYDGYELSGGAYSLLTTGPLDEPAQGPFSNVGGSVVWASDDGAHVYFLTSSRMNAEDTDGATDVYERSNGQTRLVSTGPSAVPFDPNLNYNSPEANFLGASTDGATAFFATSEQLTPDDTEKLTSDIFSWHDGVTRRVTHTVNRGEGPGVAYEIFDHGSFGGATTDGSLFYVANSPQTADDSDLYPDLYVARPDGSTQRLTSTPPGGTLASESERFLRPGAASRDGSRVFFITTRALALEDHDQTLDIYMWSAASGTVQLISAHTQGAPGNKEELHLDAISRDGRRAFFESYEQLTAADTDDEVDVYEWSDGGIRLVSPASDGRQTYAFFKGVSPNGRYVAFSTFEELLGGDNDAKEDIYVIDMGASDGGGTAGSSARPTPASHRRAKPRLRLVTAEAIPPRMTIAASGTFASGAAAVRLRCPKTERSGPCRGKVTLLNSDERRRLATGRFRIDAGHGGRVVLHDKRLRAGDRGSLRALARVKGADQLGNTAVVSGSVVLRHGRG